MAYASISDPVDILITDAKYEYPGGTVRYLNGDRSGRVDLDLKRLPANKGAQVTKPSSAAPGAIRSWVDSSPKWSDKEKEAVKELIFNFARIIVANEDDPVAQHALSRVASNWREAIDRLGFPPSLLFR